MARGRPKAVLELLPAERQQLQCWARQRTIAAQLALRARLILDCARGWTNQAVASQHHVDPATVGKWRGRFVQHRLQGLNDEYRPGAPRSISDAKVAQVVRRTLQTTPPEATHWSTRSLARQVGLSHQAIARIWRAFGLQPHRSERFKLSSDPLFVDKVRDVVGLYLNPPQRALVLCIDEKSQVQALDRTQPVFPLLPGQAERQTHDYTRHGTTSLFAALDVASGQIIGQCQARHRQHEFLKFMNHVDAQVPKDQPVHLIMDNYATHKTARVKRWFARRPYYQLHFTPTSASWLNLIERFFAEITNKRLRRGTFLSVAALEQAIARYLEVHNQNPQPFVWTASTDLILAKVQSFCERISVTGH
jgi:transposase